MTDRVIQVVTPCGTADVLVAAEAKSIQVREMALSPGHFYLVAPPAAVAHPQFKDLVVQAVAPLKVIQPLQVGGAT